MSIQSKLTKSDDSGTIESILKGKTIEEISISYVSVVIKFTDGNFLDIDMDYANQEIVALLNYY